MVNNPIEHQHEYISICDDDICGKCFEDDLMSGRPKLAPRHAREKVEKAFNTIHMQNYRKQMEKVRNGIVS